VRKVVVLWWKHAKVGWMMLKLEKHPLVCQEGGSVKLAI